MAREGAELALATPAEFAALIKGETQKWAASDEVRRNQAGVRLLFAVVFSMSMNRRAAGEM